MSSANTHPTHGSGYASMPADMQPVPGIKLLMIDNYD